MPSKAYCPECGRYFRKNKDCCPICHGDLVLVNIECASLEELREADAPGVVFTGLLAVKSARK